MMDHIIVISKLSAFKQAILLSFLSLSLIACSGGGSDPETPAPPPDPVVMELGSPSASPFVTPPSPVASQVSFFSVVSGNALPPEELFLDEVDVNGQVVAANVTQLRDDGENVDSNLGDRIYTGSLLLGSVESTEKYYRVRTELNGETLTSGKMAFWISGCPVTARPSDSTAAVFDPQSTSLIFSNEVTITVNEGIAPDLAEMNRIAAEVNGQIVGCIPAQREYLIEMQGDGTAAGVYSAIDTLTAHPAVELASINTQIAGLPLGAGAPCVGDECQWYLERIRAPEAWLLAGGGDEERSVAVIDFGVDCTHQELGCDASIHNQDLIDHGTGVASLINAAANDGSPVVGVAWNTELFPQSFLGNGGSQYKMNELINASLSDERVKVINISAGTAIDPNGNIRESICTAIDSGRLVVAAAGNAAQANNCELDNVYPAKYNAMGSCANGADLQAGLLVVGGIDVDNNLAEWHEADVGVCSNVLHVDLFAPGENVLTASAVEGYSTKSGTSYAAPLVSGAAAVLWSAHPEFTVSEIHGLLLGSGAALESGSDNPRAVSNDARVRGAPLLDLFRSVGGEDVSPASGGSPELPDVTPDAFDFTDTVEAALAVVSISAPVTIQGIDQAAPIDVVGGYYSIDNGPFTGAAGLIQAGQQVRLRVTTAAAPNVQHDVTLTIGGVSDTYSVTTGDLPVTLEDFRFVPQTNLALAEVATSNEVVIAGIVDNSPISIDAGEYSINGAGFSSGAGVINAGDTLRVRVTASVNYAATTEAIVTLSGVTGRFQATTVAADTTPDAFAFVSENNVPLATEFVSNDITVSGINTESFISISGGEYAIDGGIYTANAGSLREGQTVNIRLSSANTSQTAAFSTLTIGGVSATYSVTTLVVDTTPDVFSFTSQTNQPLNTLLTSNAQTISGINSPVAISITGGEYAIDGGGFSSAEGTISAGQSVRVRALSSAAFATTTTAVLSIGDVSADFNVTTYVADTTPDSFAFVDQTDIALGAEVTSNSITVSGLNTSVPVSIDHGMYNINGGAYTAAAGTVSNGDVLTLRLNAAASVATTVQATLTVGSSSDTFSVSTEGARLPDAFSFTDQADVQRDRSILSNTLTITGLNTAVPISITGGEYALDGGSFTNAAGVIANGQRVQVRVQSATEFATATHATLSISGVSDTFTVVTAAADTVPDAFAFAAEVNVALNAQIESNVVSIAGINSAAPISVTGGEYRLNGGSYTTAPGNVNNGDTVQVRVVASATPETTSTASLTIGGVSGTFAVTTLPADSTPEAFAFTAQTDVALSATVTSNAIVVTGINVGAAVSVSGGEYSINSGGYTAAPGTINSGDTVQVRVVASATPETTSTASLTIGGVSGAFDVTTLPADSTPEAFAFTAQTDVALSATVTSNAIVVTGINVGAAVTVSGGEYAINSGGYTTAPGDVNNGDTVQVRLTASATPETTATATLTIGGVSGTFDVTTLPADSTPEAFAFTAQTDVALNTVTTSNAIVVSGINVGAAVTVSGGEYAINSGGYTTAPGTINSGDTVQVRLTASATPATTSSATLTIGGVSGTFAVTTLPADSTPEAFAFTAQTDVALNTVTTSNAIVVSGINVGTAVNVVGGEYNINGGAFTPLSGTVNDGDQVSVRLTSAAGFEQLSTATVTIGDVSGDFNVTTRVADQTPDAFNFTPQANVPWNTLITSDTITIQGIDDATSITITGGEYALDGGGFTSTGGVINNGQTLTVRVLAAGAELSDATTTVTVGSVAASFTVTTLPAESIIPDASILFPPEVSLTDRDTLVVRGTAADSSSIASVVVNGVDAVSSDGFASWTATVPLAPGDNTVTAIVADTQNNVASQTVQVRQAPLADSLTHLLIDNLNNRYLAIEGTRLIAIDRTTGATRVLSGAGIPNDENLLQNVKDVQLSQDASRVLILDSPANLDAVKAIDLATGARSLISQDLLEEPVGTYHQIYDLAVDAAGNRVFVADSQGLIELNLATGSRRELYSSFGAVQGVVWDGVNNRVIMALHSSIVALNPDDLTTAILSNNSMAGATSNVAFDGLYDIVYDGDTNTAYTSGRWDSATVIRVDLSDGSRTLVSDNTMAVATSEIDFSNNYPKYTALDKGNNQLLVTDQSSVIAVDIASGNRTRTMSGFVTPLGIDFEGGTNTVRVLSRGGTLYSFVLGDVAPTVISDNTIAVSESTAVFGDAWALGMDLAANLAYVGDWQSASVYTVDLLTGRRTTVSDNSVPDDDNTFISPVAMIWQEAEGRALILDSGRRSIVEVDTSTGLRNVVSSPLVPDASNSFVTPLDMILQPNTSQALVLDRGIPAIVAVDPLSGARSIYGPIPNDYRLTQLRGMAFNNSDNSVLMSSDLYGITRLNSDASYESLINGYFPQVLYDGSVDNVIALEKDTSSAGTVELSSVNLTTGTITPQLAAPTPNADVLVDEPVGVAVDAASDEAYVLDQDQNAILRIDLRTGAKTFFASNDIAAASSNYNFEYIAGIALDAANNRLLVGDITQSALIAVDLTSAARTLITDDTVATGTSTVSVGPRSIAVDSAGEFAYLTDWATAAVLRVNLGTGERTVFSDNTIATALSNISFTHPRDITLDASNNRALVVDKGANAVIAVDLVTGARSEFVSRNTPLEGGGSTTFLPYYLTLNGGANQLIVVDNFLNDIYTVNLDDGVRRKINAPTSMLMRTFGLRGVGYDPSHDAVILIEGYRDAVISVDMQTGERVVLSQ